MQQNGLLAILPVGHVLHTMMLEHQVILGYLDELNKLQTQLIKRNIGDQSTILAAIATLGENLLSAENHHQREEQVLFPAIEKAGIVGPTQAMVQEHEWLRPAKQAIIDMAESSSTVDASGSLASLEAKIDYLTSLLRSHIAREDQVLYPMAINAIPGADAWDALKQACDVVGYCPFTPSQQGNTELV